MKFDYNLNLPQKVFLVSRFYHHFTHQLPATYFYYGNNFESFFGFSQIQIIAGSLFNIVLNLSILILVVNLFIKKSR